MTKTMTMTGGGSATTPISLPTVSMLIAGPTAALVSGAAWYAVAVARDADSPAAIAAPAGAALVAVIIAAAVMIIQPWTTRPIAEWMTWWLGSTVFRLLITPLGAFLLYSAAPLPATPLTLGVATAYLVSLLCETAVLARHVRKHC